MNLEKAKEIIYLNINEAGKKMPSDVLTAITIGSEAIVFFERWRLGYYFSPSYRLPSETVD